MEDKNGYKKRPMLFWVILYLIIGAIIYGIIYFTIVDKYRCECSLKPIETILN